MGGTAAGTEGASRPLGHGRVPPLFVYDGDCGFCTVTARWIERRLPPVDAGGPRFVPWQAADLGTLGLTQEEVTTAAWWVGVDGRQSSGADALAAALRTSRRGWRVLGAVVAAWPVRLAARPAYRAVARNRHTLPGASDACRVPGATAAGEAGSSGRLSTWRARVVAYGVLAIIAFVALGGREAWPLSSFALFSKIRTGEQVTTQVVAVDRTGQEHPIALGRNRQAGRGASHLLPYLRARPRAQRVAEVKVWMRAAGIDPARMRAARVYRTVRRVSTTGRLGRVLCRRRTLEVPLGPRAP